MPHSISLHSLSIVMLPRQSSGYFVMTAQCLTAVMVRLRAGKSSW